MFIFVSPPAKLPCCRIDSTPLCNRGFLGSLQGSCLMFVTWLMSAFLMKIWMENGELIGNSLDVLPCDERGMEKTWKNPPAMRIPDGFYPGKSGKTPHFYLRNGMMIPSISIWFFQIDGSTTNQYEVFCKAYTVHTIYYRRNFMNHLYKLLLGG